MRSRVIILGHGNPGLGVILKDRIEADLKLLPVRYSIQCTRIKENRKEGWKRESPDAETSGQESVKCVT